MLFAAAHGCRALLIAGLCLLAWPAWGQLVEGQAAGETQAGPARDSTEAGEGHADDPGEDDAPRAAKAGQDVESLYNLSPIPADSPAHRFYQALVRRLPDFSSARAGRRGRLRSKPEGAPTCPFCGQWRHEDPDSAMASDLPKSGLERSTFRAGPGPVAAADAADDEGEALRSGEPAEVILEMRKRLGASMLDGTDFSGPPDLLVKWIRALDAENRLRQAEEYPACDADDGRELGPRNDLAAQVAALRDASRQLQAAAELLEDQNLFEPSDEIRTLADRLRRQSRQKLNADDRDREGNLRKTGERAERREDAKTRIMGDAETERPDDASSYYRPTPLPRVGPVHIEAMDVKPSWFRTCRVQRPFSWAMGIMR